eukprot:CAMPEP_0197541594 /NCGR_PEP_ID=MMETSP1318-20131121/67247_1 /TAXON_ID=552666 /ORGANISM="Partenskyella glossopodia, Strain RCC365" /LENGTH=121 /DNA_ID=CAMNT_0043100787 /DNA_START=386 /DNA_END=751 /DNA_ORIENTATION=+
MCKEGKIKILEDAAKNYFEVWNSQDLKALEGTFIAENAYLRDWDIEKKGTKEVVAANGGIFKAVPKIKITVEKLHPNPTGMSIACEILVHLNDDNKTVLKVVDVIEMSDEGKIKAVRAYKG